jgi:hypothetical protein
MPVIVVLASSSLSGTALFPCGPHANLFDRWSREEEHQKIFLALIFTEELMTDTDLKCSS